MKGIETVELQWADMRPLTASCMFAALTALNTYHLFKPLVAIIKQVQLGV